MVAKGDDSEYRDFFIDWDEFWDGNGGQILRLDAFAYLHKQVGQSNYFNRPGTWEYP